MVQRKVKKTEKVEQDKYERKIETHPQYMMQKYHHNLLFSIVFLIYFWLVSITIFPTCTAVFVKSIFYPDSINKSVPNFALLSTISKLFCVILKKQCFLLIETSSNFTSDSWPLPKLTFFLFSENFILIWTLFFWEDFLFSIP